MWANVRSIFGAIAAIFGFGSAVSTFADFATGGKVDVLLVTLGGAACILAIGLFVVVMKQATSGITWTNAAKFALVSSILGTASLLILVVFSGIALASASRTAVAPPTGTSASTTTNSPTSTTISAASATTSPDAVAAILTPGDGSTIQPGQDVKLSGTASGLGDNDLWVISRADSADRLYYIIDPMPLQVETGTWSVIDQSTGDETDRGHAILFIAVKASHACSKTLENTPANRDGVMSFPALPDGCEPIGDPVAVNIAAR